MLLPLEGEAESTGKIEEDDQSDDEAFLDEDDGNNEPSSVIAGQVDNDNPPLPPIQFLPPVELVIENEIWQYSYPPFESLLTNNVNEGLVGRSNTIKSQSDALPSYVIGILDPAELVSGIFRTPFAPSFQHPVDGSSSISRDTNSVHQQQFQHQFQQHQQLNSNSNFDDVEAFLNHDETFRRGFTKPSGVSPFPEEKVTRGGQRSIVVSAADDRWIWKS